MTKVHAYSICSNLATYILEYYFPFASHHYFFLFCPHYKLAFRSILHTLLFHTLIYSVSYLLLIYPTSSHTRRGVERYTMCNTSYTSVHIYLTWTQSNCVYEWKHLPILYSSLIDTTWSCARFNGKQLRWLSKLKLPPDPFVWLHISNTKPTLEKTTSSLKNMNFASLRYS